MNENILLIAYIITDNMEESFEKMETVALYSKEGKKAFIEYEKKKTI